MPLSIKPWFGRARDPRKQKIIQPTSILVPEVIHFVKCIRVKSSFIQNLGSDGDSSWAATSSWFISTRCKFRRWQLRPPACVCKRKTTSHSNESSTIVQVCTIETTHLAKGFRSLDPSRQHREFGPHAGENLPHLFLTLYTSLVSESLSRRRHTLQLPSVINTFELLNL